ncbi:SH3 domain-containing protein [Hyalangium rubrum]|uniref:SH3 domain-containing protein n=1 Tax=Hyalangium rubrum TaxID=3103134 RepID=A0ABU5HEW5_9BACT|nr:SH3 domain-containing protein [Hyalangium sp. s54d21]MDY7231697.1 SH3 domain-containing protein [Hyalangium sp. s54d21]
MRTPSFVLARAPVWLLVVLLAAACGKPEEMTVIQEGVELRETAHVDAAVAEKLPLGARVTLHAPHFWEDSEWHRIETKAGPRWTKLEGLAPYPLRGETRFVRVEELPVRATRESSGRLLETVLKLGDEVQLLAAEPPGEQDYRGVIRGGLLLGYVDGFGLGAEKPTTRNLLETAKEYLRQGDMARTKALARAAATMAEGTGRSGALVQALEQAETEPSALLDELTSFGEKAYGDTPPAKGAVGYVVPYRASLREGPDLRDPIITVLPVEAAVEVQVLQGEWAQVALIAKQTPWMSVDLGDLAQVQAGDTAELSSAQRGARARGYLQLTSIQAKRLSPAEHLAKVNALSREEHEEQRLELLKRALVIAEAKDVSQIAPALIDEAFQSERYRLAVAAAVRMKEPERAQDAPDKGWRIETVTSIYGCSGPPLEAQVERVDFEPDNDYPKPAGSVCALVTGFSSPCDVCLSDLAEYDDEERQRVLKDKVGVDNALSTHEDVITRHLKATTNLEDAYPRPSRMKVTVRTAAGAPPGRLFLFELPLEVDRYQPKLAISPSFKEARVSEVALLDSAAQGKWEYWMSTLQWEDVAHGAVFAPEPKAARKAVQDFARALKANPAEVRSRNESAGVVYAVHVSEHCGRCPGRRE